MLSKSGLNKEIIKKMFSSSDKGGFIRSLFAPKFVFADEPTGGNEDLNNKPVVNYEDLIAKARKEEKDKLYPQIDGLKNDVANWTKKCNEHLITIGQKEAEITDLQKKLKESGKDDSDVVKGLKAEIEKLKKDLEDAKKNAPDEKAIEDRIKAEYEVKLYREQKIHEAADLVIPELVMGTTKEDIDKSLEASKKRFKEMSDKILKGSSGSIPIANTNTSKFNKNFTIEDLAKLDPRSPEYKEFRKQMGLK